MVYNPFLAAGEVYFCEADATLFELICVDCPAFICLAYELCHALHILSGDGKAYPFPEEPWTVGWANTRISETAQYNAAPGDGD